MKMKKEMKKAGMVAMFALAMTTSLFANEGEKKEIKNDEPVKVAEAPAYTVYLTINGMMIELSPIDVYAKNDTDATEESIEPTLKNEDLAMLDDADSFYEKMRIENAIEDVKSASYYF
ncbi:hypothetical protein [Plebeiibacterium marinum]|uniref:Uncharacterized protein n=1 Tax=Plebeiibacterium marinum TaxID=2992111 RepID=A0AAE3SIL8_9BACT|nr:hypothetical protein [Plebeiobacterium marinum]MCW3804534.1 hypothetical protein [Plebeiobacterium marinum]